MVTRRLRRPSPFCTSRHRLCVASGARSFRSTDTLKFCAIQAPSNLHVFLRHLIFNFFPETCFMFMGLLPTLGVTSGLHKHFGQIIHKILIKPRIALFGPKLGYWDKKKLFRPKCRNRKIKPETEPKWYSVVHLVSQSAQVLIEVSYLPMKSSLEPMSLSQTVISRTPSQSASWGPI